MFGSMLQGLTGLLDRRFLRTTWLPSLLLWLALLALAVTAVGWATALRWWEHQPLQLQLVLAAVAAAWVTFSAFLLGAIRGALIRLFEGYWDGLPGGARLAERRQADHGRALAQLQARDYNAAYLLYPALPEWAMPTRFGNVLKSAETYPLQRYNMDGVLMWPRLYGTLPGTFVAGLAAAAADLELMVNVSAVGVAFAVLGGALAVPLLPFWAAPACVWGGALIAWLGYEGLVRNAVPYAELVKTAFDLHRGTLLTTIGWSTPVSLPAERAQWNQIAKLWYRGVPDGLAGAAALGYPLKPPAAPSEPEPDRA